MIAMGMGKPMMKGKKRSKKMMAEEPMPEDMMDMGMGGEIVPPKKMMAKKAAPKGKAKKGNRANLFGNAMMKGVRGSR